MAAPGAGAVDRESEDDSYSRHFLAVHRPALGGSNGAPPSNFRLLSQRRCLPSSSFSLFRPTVTSTHGGARMSQRPPRHPASATIERRTFLKGAGPASPSPLGSKASSP